MKKIKRLSKGELAFQLINGLIFTLITFICVIPFYYLLINTISDNEAVARGDVLLRPVGIHFQNYINILKNEKLARAFLVTISRVVLGTSLSVFANSFLGYCFTKKELFARKYVYRFVVITMYFSAGLIPQYINYSNLGLTNTFWIYIIGFVNAYNIILIKTYIESLPMSLEESAKLDGAGYITIFTKIIFPLSVPIIATITVFDAVGHWNSFMDTVLYIRDEQLYTVQYILYLYLNEAEAIANIMKQGNAVLMDAATRITPTAVKMTVTMVVVIPILFVYPFFQRFFVKGIMLGAVKG